MYATHLYNNIFFIETDTIFFEAIEIVGRKAPAWFWLPIPVGPTAAW